MADNPNVDARDIFEVLDEQQITLMQEGMLKELTQSVKQVQEVQDFFKYFQEFNQKLHQQTKATLDDLNRYYAARAAGENAKLTVSVDNNISVEMLDEMTKMIMNACTAPRVELTVEEQTSVSDMLDKIAVLRKFLEAEQTSMENLFKVHKLANKEANRAIKFAAIEGAFAVGCLLAAAALTAVTILTGGAALLPIIAVLLAATGVLGVEATKDVDLAAEAKEIDQRVAGKYLKQSLARRQKIIGTVGEIRDDIREVVLGLDESLEEELDYLGPFLDDMEHHRNLKLSDIMHRQKTIVHEGQIPTGRDGRRRPLRL